jgi:serine/arginine repetitive matrix protein 2
VSSFYFKVPTQTGSLTRSHRRHKLNLSQAPPVSLFNCSIGTSGHCCNNWSTSTSSVTQLYVMHGVGGGHASWVRHHHDPLMDLVLSDFSALHLGRPGIGDKMFDMAGDHGVQLAAISASPSESIAEPPQFANRTLYVDSIMDNDRRLSLEDSLFKKTDHRSASESSDLVFGYDDCAPAGALLLPNHFWPLSVLSLNTSTHGPMREDDTMISVSAASSIHLFAY